MPGPALSGNRAQCRDCGRDTALVWSRPHQCFVIRAHGYTNSIYAASNYCPGTGDRPAGEPSLTEGPTKTRPGDQALPVKNDEPIVQDELKEFIERRKQVGIARYGTALQPHNGRDALRDAFEEAVDLAVYLAQVIIERDGKLP